MYLVSIPGVLRVRLATKKNFWETGYVYYFMLHS